MLQLLFTILTLKQSTAAVIVSSPAYYADNWKSNYDQAFEFSGSMMRGIYSHHSNKREDRRWQFYKAKIIGVPCSERPWTSWQNSWDEKFSFSCGSQQALSGIKSIHSNREEDRVWKFRCCDLFSNVRTGSSRWTYYLNDFDEDVKFYCGESEVLSGLESYHSNRHEDRRWKAKCVALVDDDAEVFLSKTPILTGTKNYWNQKFSYRVDNGLYSGLYSVHDNRREDRQFKVYESKLARGIYCTNYKWSGYVNDFDERFSFSCGWNSAIFYIESYHSNRREDRRFKFGCCDLSNNGAYQIRGMYWTGYVNEWDGKMNFKCGYNEVLMGLGSYHNNRREDRRFKFRCGRLMKNTRYQCGFRRKGYCVTANGKDQNSGVIKLGSGDVNTTPTRYNCLQLCLKTPGLTGCEGIWGQSNRGCYAHTKSVSRGNGAARHVCWIC